MARKRKTLPKDFREIIKRGDIDEIKTVFDKCELNAAVGSNRDNALFCFHIQPELMQWLIGQGLDVNSRNCGQATPLHVHARHSHERTRLLIELGADINARDMAGKTPLHSAASGANAETVRILLANGAESDAVAYLYDHTPLEHGLAHCDNLQIAQTAEVAEILINAGAKITDKCRKSVTSIGERFEFYKSEIAKNIPAENFAAAVDGLQRLYQMFDVPPVPPRRVHDGRSPITVSSDRWQAQHNELWKLLVPGSGHADTIQGEVIRITGRVSYEILDNGSINWDGDYRKMLCALHEYFRKGSQLPAEELTEADKCINAVSRSLGEAEIEKLCELAVRWVLANPDPIAMETPDYTR